MGRSALLADSQGNLRADRGSYLMFTCLPCRKQSDQVARPQEPRRAGRAGRLRAVVRGTRTPAVPGTSRLSVLLVAARRWVLAGNWYLSSQRYKGWAFMSLHTWAFMSFHEGLLHCYK